MEATHHEEDAARDRTVPAFLLHIGRVQLPFPVPVQHCLPNRPLHVATAWHIDRGRAGSTALDGLNVVGIYHTPDAPGGEFRANLYIDDKAMPDQRTALMEIFSGRWGGQMGTDTPGRSANQGSAICADRV